MYAPARRRRGRGRSRGCARTAPGPAGIAAAISAMSSIGVTGSSSPPMHQRRALYAPQRLTEVGLLRLASRTQVLQRGVGARHGPAFVVRIHGLAVVQRDAALHVVGGARHVELGPELRRDLRHLLAAEPPEDAGDALDVEAGAAAQQDELARMLRVARRVRHRDLAAERRAADDRPLDLQRLAERAHVVAPLRQRPQPPSGRGRCARKRAGRGR